MKQKGYLYIVDDREESALLLSDLLSLAGYTTFTFLSGREALTALQKAQQSDSVPMPDLILLDLMMPEMDGLEVVQRIKSDQSLPFIPTIIITASVESNDRVMGLQVGADDFLTKPINRAELLARVRSLLRLKQAYDDQARLLGEVKTAYEQLSATQTELVSAEKNKAQMEAMMTTAGAICHEMSQPLTSAMITLQMLKQELPNPENQNDITSVEESLLQARSILDRLRSLTRYETKPYIGKERILDLERSSSSVFLDDDGSYSTIIDEHGREFVIEDDEPLIK